MASGASVGAPVVGGVQMAALPHAQLLHGVAPVGERAEKANEGGGIGIGGRIGTGAEDVRSAGRDSRGKEEVVGITRAEGEGMGRKWNLGHLLNPYG